MAKSIKTLLEGELEKAQLALAARDLVDQLQTMVQDLTKLKVEDLPALKESIRGTMGNEIADQFVGSVDPALDAAIQAVTQSKEQLDQAALAISGDAEMPMGGGDMGGDEMPPEMGDEAPVTNTAAGGDDQVGRGRRESRYNRMKAMMESLERKIAETKKAKKKKVAAKKIDEWYDDEDGEDFADPGGHSALRAAGPGNPRNRKCPSCGAKNRLTKRDVELGYQCDACADRAEGRRFDEAKKKTKKVVEVKKPTKKEVKLAAPAKKKVYGPGETPPPKGSFDDRISVGGHYGGGRVYEVATKKKEKLAKPKK